MPSEIHFLDERHILLFLAQFFLLLGLAKLLGFLFTRLKQPAITADMLVGIILGPTIFGRFFPQMQELLFPNDVIQRNMIETVAWIGILFMLLATGLEVNFSSVWKQRSQAIKISLADIVIPIFLTGALTFFLPDRYLVDADRRLLFSLFLGAIMTISAMPVAIRAMRDLRLMKTDMGFLVISALSINDIVGWMIFTIVLGLFSQKFFNPSYALFIVAMTVGFAIAALTVGKWFMSKAISVICRRTNDHTGYSLTLVALAGMAFGFITQKIGIHALFGFFVAGMIAGEAKELSERTRCAITQMVHAVFVPIFFANIGLKFDLIADLDLFLVGFITVIGVATRFAAAYVGTRLAHAPAANRLPIAVLHTPGGEMHIVIGTLAMELGLITTRVYVAIIAGAVLSSITLGPWLAYVIKKRQSETDVGLPLAAVVDLGDDLDKSGVIELLCSKAAAVSGLDGGEVCAAVNHREELMSTALEHGVAIPHARLPNIKQPVILYGRHASGVEWNSPDNIPARHIVLILSPLDDRDTQLQLYSSLARALSRQRTREQIMAAKTADEVHNVLRRDFEASPNEEE